jgi:hypothetical protein
MKLSIYIGLFCLLPGSAAVAGTITGLVLAKGPMVADQPAADGAYASMRYKFAEKVDYDRLEDFVISIDQPVPEPPGSPPPAATVTQHNVSFEPHVLPIVVGTKVRWPNKDDIFHNIFSMSDAKDFDLGLYTKEKVPEITFDKIGQVDVFCSIHSKMHCIILVLPSRYFAKVNAHQHYFLRDVPAGTYKLRAWQERVPARVREVTVPAEGEVRVDFTLGVGLSDLPKY